MSFQESRSTWANGWKKIRTLAPFLWPKNSFSLQLRVILCIILLIGGRVINVVVPIFNQKIGKLEFEQIFDDLYQNQAKLSFIYLQWTVYPVRASGMIGF